MTTYPALTGGTHCEGGRLWQHRPQDDDPYFEHDIGQCPDCNGAGCDRDPNSLVNQLRNARMMVNCGHGDVRDVPDPLHMAAAVELERLAKELAVEREIVANLVWAAKNEDKRRGNRLVAIATECRNNISGAEEDKSRDTLLTEIIRIAEGG